MRPSNDFTALDRGFLAHVKLVSEKLGYSLRGAGTLRRFTETEIIKCLAREPLLSGSHLHDGRGRPTPLCTRLAAYLNYRAEILESEVARNLMDREQAGREFERLRRELKPSDGLPLPMNKQKGEKRHYNYMGCIVNMLTESSLGRANTFVAAPRGLAVATKDGIPLRTFSRWYDGVFPTLVDPVAVWEIKEHHGTTTFGSRVADGVYETMLDGEEFSELLGSEKRKILHYLIVDDRFTWWDKGRSYLCRIIDCLHAGLVDEVLFGREVLERWEAIVKSWLVLPTR